MPSDPPTPSLSFSSGTILLGPLPEMVLRRVFDPLAWVWDARVRAWRIDAIEYTAVRERLTSRHLACDDTVPRWHAVRWPKVELHALRTEQQQAVAAWL